MKKLIISSVMFLALAFAGNAQSSAPSCNNDNGLEGRINGIEASGWVELSREFVPVNYLVEPTPPYLIGTLYVIFGPDCDPGEPCTKIAMIYAEDATQITQNTCVWQPTQIH